MATQQNGIIITDFANTDDLSESVTLQTDGKILVAGYSGSYPSYCFAIVRYNSNGSLDTTFDGDGKLTTAIGTSDDKGKSVTLQTDGKILVAGRSYNGSNDDFALVRYNSNGALDTTFDGDGKLTTAIDTYEDGGQSVTLQTDGKILVAGYSDSSGGYDFALVRYNSNGSLDTTFDGDGKLTTAISTSDTSDDFGESVTLQTDGKILVAGTSDSSGGYDFALVRYNSNGSLDTTFDGDGKLTTAVIGNVYNAGYSVTLQTDGKILVAGVSNRTGGSDFALVRYNSNGSLDTTFDGDGKLTTAISTYSDEGLSVTLQTDGKILVAGVSDSDFALVRYNSDGSLDTTFDGDGKLTTAISTSSDVGQSVTLQTDGKILVAGYSTISDNDFALVRYNSDGSLDATFDGGLITNNAPTGAVVISDTTPEKNQVLSVSNTLADLDGLGTVVYTWKTGTTVLGKGNTYIVTANEVGKTIQVTANYTDDLGNAESVSSLPTSVVIKPVIINHLPTGNVTINDSTPKQGQTLTVSSTLADADGLGTIHYQWKANGIAISDATSNTYHLTQAQVGKTISVTASYTDGLGKVETKTSATTSAVANVNDLPTGNVTINDTTPKQGQTLTVSNTLADLDGLGTIHYQWKANGTAISGATAATYKLTQAQVGKTISVTASYTDGLGTAESKTSTPTSAVVGISPDVLFTRLSPNENTSEGNYLVDGTLGLAVKYSVTLKVAPHPDHQVVINFTSSNTSEGTVTPKLTFTSSNWNTPQTLTIQGVDDMRGYNGNGDVAEGATAYTITATINQNQTNALEYLTVFLPTYILKNNDDIQDIPINDSPNSPRPSYGADDPSKSYVDYMVGGNLNDVLHGGRGIDELKGGYAHDELMGDDGNDRIYGQQGNDDLYGGYGNDQLHGNEGNDKLYGEQGYDILYGNAGSDWLDGGIGADTMSGGTGDDTYIVDDINDIINDAGSSTDVDNAWIQITAGSYSLGTSLENAKIKNDADVGINGNAQNNVLEGGLGNNFLNGGWGNDNLNGSFGNDILQGGKGKDVLTGGVGQDIFKFSDTSKDTLLDFSAVDDTIQLENAVFTKLTTLGVLNPANFKIGTAAADANDYLVYNQATGALFYDADGNSSGSAVQIAVLGVNLALTHNDFVVI